MHLKFRIDWGYIFLYSRRIYHPEYCWDGHLEITGGSITSIWKAQYPIVWFGPTMSPRLERLPTLAWKDSTRRGFSGIVLEAEVTDDTRFKLVTASGTFQFFAEEIITKGRIVFDVGSKYSNNTVIVTRDGYYWFRPEAKPGDFVLDGCQITTLPVVNYYRMDSAQLNAQQTLEFVPELPPPEAGTGCQVLLHLQAQLRGLKEDFDKKDKSFGMRDVDGSHEIPVMGELTLEVTDEAGRILTRMGHFYRAHDCWCQLLEDVWGEFDLPSTPCKIRIRNTHGRLPLMINRIVLHRQPRQHLQLTVPAYLLKNEPFVGRIFARREDTVQIIIDGAAPVELTLKKGWNDFPLVCRNAGKEIPVVVRNATESVVATVGTVFDLAEENPPVKVGYDLTVINHDASGELDWLLDYTWRTRLGNYMALRSFHYDFPVPYDAADEQIRGWGEAARKYRIYLQGTNCYRSGALLESAKEFVHNAGPHEKAGVIYALDPDNLSTDMKDATERFIAYCKTFSDEVHALGMKSALGDAGGGPQHLYAAGMDYIRTETMVSHTMLLCSIGRAAARACDRPEWGVHIAIQHGKTPYLKEQLGIYWLSLFQPWMMDASFIYEEDSLFQLFKEERQCWDDLLTKGKRDMTRSFFQFAKTHPRQGRSRPAIALIEGRYTSPFSGFICGTEQDPDYSVWGKFGRSDKASWRHSQPEKVFQLADILMPGASTHPFMQKHDLRRFYFSGTPYGDFNRLPVDAPLEYWQEHKLAIQFGWNTMIPEDHRKMVQFVQNGGTLLIGIPEFCSSADRDILENVAVMPLWNEGDLSELAGIRVKGAASEFSGEFRFLVPGFEKIPVQSRDTWRGADEDGACPVAAIELAGAEVVAVDASTNVPLAVRFRLGQGEVLCLTTLAFPGHEKLADLAGALLAGLARRNRSDYRIEEESGEIFWTWRPLDDKCGQLMALNTDWMIEGNVKPIRVVTPFQQFDTAVAERQAKILTVLHSGVLEPMDADIPAVEIIGADSVRITSANDRAEFLWHPADDIALTIFLDLVPGLATVLAL